MQQLITHKYWLLKVADQDLVWFPAYCYLKCPGTKITNSQTQFLYFNVKHHNSDF